MAIMRRFCLLCGLLLLFALPSISQAGLYYSGEPMAKLPSQWRGFLLDQRTLRLIGYPAKKGGVTNPIRKQYLQKAQELEKANAKGQLTADQLADLGAIYVRLRQPEKAVILLRKANRKYPRHFKVAANLGTAWQQFGDLRQAIQALQQAVSLAPEKYRVVEEYHLKLVTLRLREPKNSTSLDNLFGVRYVDKDGKFKPGKMAPDQKKKLPKHAVATIQQLSLWLPSDARLLWQLAEIANAYGDVRVAANMMDGCVTQFGLQSRDLRKRRLVMRGVVAKLKKIGVAGKAEHKKNHVGGIVAQSRRPLLTRIDQSILPKITANGVNRMPWGLLRETEVGQKFNPTFPDYIKKLNGKTVTLSGFMQPFSTDLDVETFMFLEYPVGCWYCESPEMTSIIFVEMPSGTYARYNRGLMSITGRLTLNYSDPEEYLYIIRNAKVGGID